MVGGNSESGPRHHWRTVAVPALVATTLLTASIALVVWSMSAASTAGQLEHEEQSAFSHIRIRRDGDIRALTFVRDGGQEAVQSRIDLTAPHMLMSPYARGMFASYLYQPHPRRILIVGLGGGAMVRFLTHHEPQVTIDAVEIDPAVVRLADKYFGVSTGGNVRVHTADAVTFIENATGYDVILMDAFLRPSDDTDTTGVPTRLKTRAFLGELKGALAPGGVVAFNVNEHDTMADDIAAVKAVFGQVVVYRCPPSDNKVIIAGESGLASDEEVRARIGALDVRFGGALSFGDVLANRE
ncbi:MAG TPA: fused MFS/spermidine synthase [Vicinamibacterales bacterium]